LIFLEDTRISAPDDFSDHSEIITAGHGFNFEPPILAVFRCGINKCNHRPDANLPRILDISKASIRRGKFSIRVRFAGFAVIWNIIGFLILFDKQFPICSSAFRSAFSSNGLFRRAEAEKLSPVRLFFQSAIFPEIPGLPRVVNQNFRWNTFDIQIITLEQITHYVGYSQFSLPDKKKESRPINLPALTRKITAQQFSASFRTATRSRSIQSLVQPPDD
jgi:hypothetical protein